MKKLFAVLLVVLSVFAFSVVASAENGNVLGYTVESSDSLVYSGDTVTVNLVVNENTGFVHSIVDVIYDADAVAFVEASKDSTVYTASKVMVKNPEAGKLRVTIGDMMAAINPGDAEVFSATGTVVSLTFKVNAGYEGDVVINTVVDAKNTLNTKGEMNFAISTGSLTLTAIDEATHVHTAGEAVVENNVEPTCTEAGSYDTVTYCTVCGKEASRETTTVDALGHTEEVLAAVAATCTESGLTEGKKCSVCGVVTVPQETVAAIGHAWDWVVDKEATIEEAGSKHEECGNCGAKQNEGTVIDKLPKPVDPDIPQMGDNNTVIVLLVVACAALVGVYFTAKRKVSR